MDNQIIVYNALNGNELAKEGFVQILHKTSLLRQSWGDMVDGNVMSLERPCSK